MRISTIGWIAAGIATGLAAAFMAVGLLTVNSDVKETSSFSTRTQLKFQTYCLKGNTVLKVEGGESYATTISGFMYELDATGKPVPCK